MSKRFRPKNLGDKVSDKNKCRRRVFGQQKILLDQSGHVEIDLAGVGPVGRRRTRSPNQKISETWFSTKNVGDQVNKYE